MKYLPLIAVVLVGGAASGILKALLGIELTFVQYIVSVVFDMGVGLAITKAFPGRSGRNPATRRTIKTATAARETPSAPPSGGGLSFCNWVPWPYAVKSEDAILSSSELTIFLFVEKSISIRSS